MNEQPARIQDTSEPITLNPISIIGVVFGFAALTKDGAVIWEEDPRKIRTEEDWMTCSDAEQIAEAEPDHDWRIVMDGPLKGETYQRQDNGRWVLIASNQGFA
jgi:hypothetical protein